MTALHARPAARLAARAILSALLLALGATAGRTAEISVTWILVHQEVRPQPGPRRSTGSLRLSLRGGSAISESSEATNMRGQRTGASREGQLRNPLSGSRANVTWRVQSARTLVRTAEAAQHTMTVRVTTTGTDTCKAAIAFRLKPGFREYRLIRISTGEPMFVSRMHADQIKCAVTN